MDNIVKTAMLATLYLVIICLLVWAIIPAWSLLAAGVILGTAASAVNALLLRRRIELLGQLATTTTPRRMSLGTLSRLATVLLAVMTAYRYPDTFDLVATLIACFYVQVVILVAMIVRNKHHPSGKE